MSGIIAAGAITAAGAIGKGIYGLTQEHKASQIEKNNIRPIMPVDPIYQQNVNIADQMARQGIPQEVINRQLEGIDQTQAGAVAATSRSANPGAGISSIVRQGDLAKADLNAQDAAARNKNTLLLLQQRGILARAKQDAWNYNYADKYSENLAKSQAYRGAGTQNIIGGLTDLGSAGMGLLSNRMGGLGSVGYPTQTIGQSTGSTPIPTPNSYQAPPLTTQLPNSVGFGNQMKFDPKFGFNPQYNLTVPQYNNPYFPSE